MRRIVDESRSMHGSSSWRVDSTIRSEFGWGSHTANAAIVTFEHIHSHAIVYVSEHQILVVLTGDPEMGLKYVESRAEQKFAIDLTDITDVVIKRDPSILDKKAKKQHKKLHKQFMDKKKQSVFIYLKSNELVIVDTYDSDHTAKTILTSWHSNLARSSAGLGPLLGTENAPLARAFYLQSVRCLQEAQRADEVLEVLEDFSREVLSDLELKDLTFKSRELVLVCLGMVWDLLNSEAQLKTERGRRSELLPVVGNRAAFARASKKDKDAKDKDASKGRASKGAGKGAGTGTGSRHKPGHDDVSPPVSYRSGAPTARSVSGDPHQDRDPLGSERESHLKLVAYTRLRIVKAVYKTISSLLFSSESIPSRFTLLLGPSPLDLMEWMGLCVPDIYKAICTSLGCADTPPEAEIEQEIQRSVQADRKLRNSFNGAAGSGDWDSNTPRKYGTPRVSDSLLTPVSARIGMGSANTMDLGAGGYENSEVQEQLEPLRQATRDLQGMLTFDLHRCLNLAKAMVRGHKSQEEQATLSVIVGGPVAAGLMQLKQLQPFGDMYVKQPDWEDAIESIVVRVSALLEDIASSPHVTVGPNAVMGASRGVTGALSRVGSSRSQLRLFGSSSNISLPPSGLGGLSQMVPPSPRSPPSSARSLNRFTRPRPT
eukprot:CAMPEP_0173298534 /NCGR_PEP_ID=MMETSP1143-20121109/16148_1 /TAXON_ID=483371 /ORGANISM="non described non described, Strain CCMP2298" /LENGTH=655 /DNA_ID=CAMNT_0014238665 /DNA_START=147 /DNA_END=2110 /DNA_ORIENTATION=-